MTTDDLIRVGVLGAGAWARGAHLPGYRRDPRCQRRRRSPTPRSIARARRRASSTSRTPTPTPRELIGRDDIDLIDVCTPSHTHFELAWAALEAGKHVLCEKPVAYDFRDTRRARDLARQQGPEDESRPHVPLQPGDALHARARRRRLHRHAVHLQRLRAELAVARSDEPAAAGRSRRRSVGASGVVARRLRRADHRPRAPVRRQRSQRRSSARCATSSPSGWCARPAA